MSIAATNPLSGKKPSKQPEAGGSWTDVFRTAFCVILGILSFTHSFFAFAFFALQMFCVCCGQVVLFVKCGPAEFFLGTGGGGVARAPKRSASAGMLTNAQNSEHSD